MIDIRIATRNSLARRRDFLVTLGFGVAGMVIWIITSIIQNVTTTTLSPLVQKQAIPLNPSIDEETLDAVSKRRFFEQAELQNFPIVKSSEGTETQPTSPTPTPRTLPKPAAGAQNATAAAAPASSAPATSSATNP